jgi:UDP-2-acetamido-3-amino-2,3-dideoxy-glucuronate N-acetyltransferase
MSIGSKNIGLIGAGYWGKNLVRVFYQLGVLKIVCDLDEDVLSQRKKEFPNLETTNDFKKILEDKKIRGIIIAAPAAAHYKLVKESLLAKKDVFVEKPLALNVKEGKELVEFAKKQKRVLMVGHLLLYHPAIVELKKIIRSGGLGEIRYIWSNRLNFGKLRREENVLWSFAPHDIALLIDFLGMPKEVSAFGKTYLQKNVPDITLASFSFSGGKAAHIFVSWLNPFKEQKFSVIGSKAMAVFNDQTKELIIYPHQVSFKKGQNPEAIKGQGLIVAVQALEPLQEEAKHFIECVRNRKKPLTDGKEALEVLKVLGACQRSLKKNGRPMTP